jgi:transcriptional regulator with XRE-family HTH domain
MNSPNQTPTRPGGGEPPPDGNPADPATLGELLERLIDQRGYKTLAELARHTTIPYPTLWAWQQRTRNLQRPPAIKVLKKFADDLNVPEATVFRAAGRAVPQHGQLADDELELLHLYQELGTTDKAFAGQMLRSLAERVRDQKVTRS